MDERSLQTVFAPAPFCPMKLEPCNPARSCHTRRLLLVILLVALANVGDASSQEYSTDQTHPKFDAQPIGSSRDDAARRTATELTAIRSDGLRNQARTRQETTSLSNLKVRMPFPRLQERPTMCFVPGFGWRRVDPEITPVTGFNVQSNEYSDQAEHSGVAIDPNYEQSIELTTASSLRRAFLKPTPHEIGSGNTSTTKILNILVPNPHTSLIAMRQGMRGEKDLPTRIKVHRIIDELETNKLPPRSFAVEGRAIPRGIPASTNSPPVSSLIVESSDRTRSIRRRPTRK
jgi:hypothetical protein